MDIRAQTIESLVEVLFGILKVVFAAVLTVLPVYFLWNSVMPVLGLPRLSFFQVWSLLLLINLLLGGSL